MKKHKKHLSLLLTLIIILSMTIPQVFAMQEKYDYFSQVKTDMKEATDGEVGEYLDKYGKMFERKNIHGLDMNYTSYKNTGLFYYGNVSDASDNYENGGGIGANGGIISLGQTYQGKDYSNILLAENKMTGHEIVKDSVDNPKAQNAYYKPFESDWNKPDFVGEKFLGEEANPVEKVAIGNKLIDLWLSNVINRTPEVNPYSPQKTGTEPSEYNGMPFMENGYISNLAEMRSTFQITSPPTSKSYGTKGFRMFEEVIIFLYIDVKFFPLIAVCFI